VIWLFVNRNFAWQRKRSGKAFDDKDLPGDMEALRIHDRFGISSWPQMILFDPRNNRILETPPRSVKGLTACFRHACKQVPPAGPGASRLAKVIDRAVKLHAKGRRREAEKLLEPLAEGKDRYLAWQEARRLLKKWRGPQRPALTERLSDPDPRERILALEDLYVKGMKRGKKGAALPAALEKRVVQNLQDDREDPVVRHRALWILAEARPEIVTQNAPTLLRIPLDPFRYQVLETLARHPDTGLGPELMPIFEGAGREVPSKNPNVLRIHAVRALETCGDPRCVSALAAVARAADARNSLTSLVIQALTGIARRGKKTLGKKVENILLESFPPPVEAGSLGARQGQWTQRRRLALAKKVLASLRDLSGGRLPALPGTWTAPVRDSFLKGLKRSLK